MMGFVMGMWFFILVFVVVIVGWVVSLILMLVNVFGVIELLYIYGEVFV